VMQHDNSRVLPYATPKPARPFWVKLGLWGLPNRAFAWAFFWICVAIAAYSAIRGFSKPKWFWGVGLILAALWYWASIRWVDRHCTWNFVPSPVEIAKRVLAANEVVLFGIFGCIKGSGYFPPREFLNEFLMGGNDPCDQDSRMGTWPPISLSPEEYRQVFSWWLTQHRDTVEDNLGAETFSDWVQKIFDLDERRHAGR
jgi:hypothetical protein